jgi:hypothetical protein
MPDAHKNFAISTVATAPSPATSGTSLLVAAGHGARFPAAPFYATVWPASASPDPTNAEVVRVTNINTDTLTITRAQDDSSARSIIVGDRIAQTVNVATLEQYAPALAASQAEAEAGTETALRSWSPERVFQTGIALGGTGLLVASADAPPSIRRKAHIRCDGTGNDHLDILQALDDVGTNGLVELSYGAFDIGGAIPVVGSLTGSPSIVGSGKGTVLQIQNGVDADIFTTSVGSINRYMRFWNFKVEGNSAGNSSGKIFNLRGARNSELHHIWFRDSVDSPIFIESDDNDNRGWYNSIYKCEIDTCVGGIRIDGFVEHTYICENIITFVTGIGIFDNDNNARIMYNMLDVCSGVSIHVEFGAGDHRIIGNHIDRPGDDGILLRQSHRALVAYNFFGACAANRALIHNGPFTGEGSNDVSIIGNKVTGSAGGSGSVGYKETHLNTGLIYYGNSWNGGPATAESFHASSTGRTEIDPAAASQAEAEAGTETALRSFSPLRIAQAIAALETGGGGGGISGVSTQAGATYTLDADDANTLVSFTNNDYVVVTVPPNSSVAYPIPTEILLQYDGTRELIVAAGAGVTIRSYGNYLGTQGQYAVLKLVKKATDTWVLAGATDPETQFTADRFYAQNTQTEPGTTGTPPAMGTIYDLSATQGTPNTTQSAEFTSSATFVLAHAFIFTVGAINKKSFDLSVVVNFIEANAEARIGVQRRNSSNAVQEEVYGSAFTTNGTKTATVVLAGPWEPGDRICLATQLRSPAGGGKSLNVTVMHASTYIDMEVLS